MGLSVAEILAIVVGLIFACAFVLIVYKVELLEKEIEKVRIEYFNLIDKVETESLRTLQRIGNTQDLVEKSLDHSRDVLESNDELVRANKDLLKKVDEVIDDSKTLRQQARDILNNNIEICEMCEELKESCQQLLKAGTDVDVMKGEEAV